VIDVRERISGGNLRRRATRQARRSIRPLTTLAIALALAAACGAYLLLHIDRTALVGSNTYSFRVNDATAVRPGVDEVRFKGIPAGTVSAVALQGTQPVITVALQSSFGHVYRNATAQLRPNTPLQDMYLDITSRGTPSAGLAGPLHPVSAAQTDTSVSISDVLDVFGSNERSRLSELLAALGNGLADRGYALRSSFVELVPFVAQAGRITEQLQRHSRLTQQLVHNVGLLTTTLGQRATEIRTLVAEGAKTMRTLGDNAPAVRATLTELPPTIASADDALTALQSVLPSVNGAARSLDPVAARLPQALRDIRTLTRVARPAVIALQRPVARLVPLANSLVPVASNLSASVKSLLPQVPVLQETVSGIGKCLPSLYGFFAWDASMAKFGDARGGAPRGNAVAGAQSLAGTKSPFEFPEQACTPGQAISGRLPTAGDYR
jgi:phospholipid/cholesterol/gamma-HCH transport system substrate-binding protein